MIPDGADFIVLDPYTLTFTSGQSIGDLQCTSVTVLDDLNPQGERNVSISIGRSEINNDGTQAYSRVHVDPDHSSLSFTIELDLDDCRF